MALSPAVLLKNARQAAGLNQRELARRAKTAQSVVARIELGITSPSWDTLSRLLQAAGSGLESSLPGANRAAASDAGVNLDDSARVLSLSPEDRMRELRNVDRFLSAVRRA